MKATEISANLSYFPTKDRNAAKRLRSIVKPKLTLHRLHALNKQRDSLRLEREIHLKQVHNMYGPKDDE